MSSAAIILRGMTGGGTAGDGAAYAPPPYGGGTAQRPVNAGPAGYPPPQFTPPRPSRRVGTTLAAAGILLAVILSAAALVISLTRESGTPAESRNVDNSATEPQARVDTAGADRDLCFAISPLLKEYNNTAKAWFSLGEPGTPARDNALPKFTSDTEAFVYKAEDVMAQHPGIQPRLERTLLRYLDDLWLLVNNIAPGQSEDYDKAAWVDATIAYGGPQTICDDLGAGW